MKSHHSFYEKKENRVDIAPVHTLSRYVTKGCYYFSIVNAIHASYRKLEKYNKVEKRKTNQHSLPHFRVNHWQHFGLFP